MLNVYNSMKKNGNNSSQLFWSLILNEKKKKKRQKWTQSIIGKHTVARKQSKKILHMTL